MKTLKKMLLALTAAALLFASACGANTNTNTPPSTSTPAGSSASASTEEPDDVANKNNELENTGDYTTLGRFLGRH